MRLLTAMIRGKPGKISVPVVWNASSFTGLAQEANQAAVHAEHCVSPLKSSCGEPQQSAV